MCLRIKILFELNFRFKYFNNYNKFIHNSNHPNGVSRLLSIEHQLHKTLSRKAWRWKTHTIQSMKEILQRFVTWRLAHEMNTIEPTLTILLTWDAGFGPASLCSHQHLAGIKIDPVSIL